MLPLANRYWSPTAAFLALVDLSIVVIASTLIREFGARELIVDPLVPFHSEWMLGFACLIAFFCDRLYDTTNPMRPEALAFRVVRSFAVAFSLVLLVGLWAGDALPPETSATVVPLLLWRLALHQALRRSALSRRLLLLGTGEEAQELANEILDRPHLGLDVVGFLGSDPSEIGKPIGGTRVVGCASSAVNAADTFKASTVVVADHGTGEAPRVLDLLRCTTRDIRVEDGALLYEQLTGRIQFDRLRPADILFGNGFLVSNRVLAAKRLLDVLVSALSLVVLAPVFALIAFAIRLDSPGPVFYRQERVGLGREKFSLWKFRSMRVDAERDQSPRWAEPDDKRVTRVGSFLRRFSLDELPQLWNILRGEMSVVGPRPEREYFVEKLSKLSPLYEYRLAVRPGLTGWAQIKAPYAASYELSLYKLSFDLYYLKRISVLLDLFILAGTIPVIVFGRPTTKGDKSQERAQALQTIRDTTA